MILIIIHTKNKSPLYERKVTNIKKEEGCFYTESKEPCIVCGKLTNRLDYCYEAYICSIECDRKFTNKLFESENQEDEDYLSII